MPKNKNVEEIGISYDQKCVWSENPGKNTYNELKNTVKLDRTI